MREQIRFFAQHPLEGRDIPETCGAACVLMLLDYYGRVQYPTVKLEHDLYSRYRVNGYMGMTAAGVARCLSFPRNALKVHLVQSFQEKMENRGGAFAPDVYEKIMASHTMHLNACANRIEFSPGVDFDTAFLKRELEKGRKIMLQCFIPENPGEEPSVIHWVILEQWEQDRALFRISDPNPRVKLLELTVEELEALIP